MRRFDSRALRKLRNHFQRVYQATVRSIAFYPTCLALGFLGLGLMMLGLQTEPLALSLQSRFPEVMVTDPDTARLVLSTLIGGLISLTVFSFSMVMVVLNRATATLSPRVLPGLISQRSHQITLGIYLGTIIYCLVLTTNISAVDRETIIPSLGILFAMVLGITSLYLFAYFIHTISGTIQVDFVLQQIYRSSARLLAEAQNRQQEGQRLHEPTARSVERPAQSREDGDEGDYRDAVTDDPENWFVVNAACSGYFKSVNGENIMGLLQEKNLVIRVDVHRAFFTVSGHPLFRINQEIDDRLRDDLLGAFQFYIEEFADEHYLDGFRHIREIAVKALSPGINDHGTAIKAMDLLTLLLIEYLQLDLPEVHRDADEQIRIIYSNQSLRAVLEDSLTPILQYGQTDLLMMQSFFQGLRNTFYTAQRQRDREVLLAYVEYCHRWVLGAMSAGADLQFIDRHVCSIRERASALMHAPS